MIPQKIQKGNIMNNKLKNEQNDKLFSAVLSLKNLEECYNFFDDLCTVAEIQAMSQRLAVAKMLANGCAYNEIATATGASTATISRIKRCLNYGSDGYKMVLERL